MKHTEELFICSCGSMEHQAFMWRDDSYEDEPLYLEIHLTTYRSFWQRLKYGLKYAFGYKSQFGAWDELIMDKGDKERLYEFLKENYE